jgi:hypothetical protein
VRRAWANTYAFIQGGSNAMRALRARIWQSIFTHDMRRYLRGLHERMGDITTLITGPSGSGKELVARAIGLSRFIPYDVAERRFAADPVASFHPINLSALSPTLIESELFGHRRGAYTGALGDRAGYFEICGEHGTVFLDEIGETAPEIQVSRRDSFSGWGTRSFAPFGGAWWRRRIATFRPKSARDASAKICSSASAPIASQRRRCGSPSPAIPKSCGASWPTSARRRRDRRTDRPWPRT